MSYICSVRLLSRVNAASGPAVPRDFSYEFRMIFDCVSRPDVSGSGPVNAILSHNAMVMERDAMAGGLSNGLRCLESALLLPVPNAHCAEDVI